jgi:hypothetical protein
MNSTAVAMPQCQNSRTPGFGAEASVYRSRPYFQVAGWDSRYHSVVLPSALPPPTQGGDGGGAPGMCRFDCNERCFDKNGCNALSGSAKVGCQNACIKVCGDNCRLWGDGNWYQYTPGVCDTNRRIDCGGITAWEAACYNTIPGGPWCSSIAKQKHSELECNLC